VKTKAAKQENNNEKSQQSWWLAMYPGTVVHFCDVLVMLTVGRDFMWCINT